MQADTDDGEGGVMFPAEREARKGGQHRMAVVESQLGLEVTRGWVEQKNMLQLQQVDHQAKQKSEGQRCVGADSRGGGATGEGRKGAGMSRAGSSHRKGSQQKPHSMILLCKKLEKKVCKTRSRQRAR